MICVNDHIELLDLPAALAAVPAQRRGLALRYRRELDQRLCVAAWLLLQQALSLGWGIQQVPPLVPMPGGKPVLQGLSGIHFNISHCDQAAAVVVDSRPVGIDVESITPCDPDLLEHTMSADERSLIAASPNPDVAFTRLWTMKESLLKLTGQGITRDLHAVLDDCDAYRFHTTVTPRYVLTVATHVE